MPLFAVGIAQPGIPSRDETAPAVTWHDRRCSRDQEAFVP